MRRRWRLAASSDAGPRAADAGPRADAPGAAVRRWPKPGPGRPGPCGAGRLRRSGRGAGDRQGRCGAHAQALRPGASRVRPCSRTGGPGRCRPTGAGPGRTGPGAGRPSAPVRVRARVRRGRPPTVRPHRPNRPARRAGQARRPDHPQRPHGRCRWDQRPGGAGLQGHAALYAGDAARPDRHLSRRAVRGRVRGRDRRLRRQLPHRRGLGHGAAHLGPDHRRRLWRAPRSGGRVAVRHGGLRRPRPTPSAHRPAPVRRASRPVRGAEPEGDRLRRPDAGAGAPPGRLSGPERLCRGGAGPQGEGSDHGLSPAFGVRAGGGAAELSAVGQGVVGPCGALGLAQSLLCRGDGQGGGLCGQGDGARRHRPTADAQGRELRRVYGQRRIFRRRGVRLPRRLRGLPRVVHAATPVAGDEEADPGGIDRGPDPVYAALRRGDARTGGRLQRQHHRRLAPDADRGRRDPECRLCLPARRLGA
uniref:LigA n=1 Tax=Parastrongyloides trichosuri TaxID=131310 RepID=A0A0N5A0Z1_PARTI